MTSLIPSVSLVDNRPATTSFAIAEHFGKRHDDVLKSIRKLMADLPDDVRDRNFAETFRTVDGPNNSQRQEVSFIVFFDGFILLAMGYTGKQALQIKLVYIAAFNAMRDELAKKPSPAPKKKLAALPLRALPRVEQKTLASGHASAMRIKALNPPPGNSGEFYEAELLRVFRDFAAWRSGVLARMEELERDYSRVTGLLCRDALHKLMRDTPLYMTDMGVWAMSESFQDAVRAVREGVHKWECLFAKAEWFAKTLRVNW